MTDARLQLRIQRYGWDAAAAYYHAGWQAQLRPAHDRLLDMSGLSAGQQVVETACGSGLVTLRIADLVGPYGRVRATDLSEAMLDDLRSRLAGTRIANIEIRRMEAEKLDIPDDAVDAALCALGLMYTPDPAAAVAEMVRVVKPGGTVAATVWGERRNCGWNSVFPIVDARVASEVCPNFFATGMRGTLAKLFENAGTREGERAPTIRNARLRLRKRGCGCRSAWRPGRSRRQEVYGRSLARSAARVFVIYRVLQERRRELRDSGRVSHRKGHPPVSFDVLSTWSANGTTHRSARVRPTSACARIADAWRSASR